MMISTSFWLGLLVAALGIGMGLLFLRTGPSLAGWSQGRAVAAALACVVGGLVGGWFAYTMDNHHRAITLFEVVADWESGSRLVDETIVLEHPGVEHTLRVKPDTPPGHKALTPVRLRIEVIPDNNDALVSTTQEFAMRDEGGGKGRLTQWDSHWFKFTPTGARTIQLRISPVGGSYPPLVFVRLEDPLKTDGERAPGY